MTDYYLVKPNLTRVIFPNSLFLFLLCLVLTLGIIINLSLFDIATDMTIIFIIFAICFCFVVLFPNYLKYNIYNKILFYFYQDKLMFNSFVIPYDKIINVYRKKELSPMKNIFDSIFNTGTVVIEMFDDQIGQNRLVELEDVNSPNEMTNYIIQIISRYRNIRGESL
ncbi:MAG: hypothetical protein WC755_00525 [Candidatus Woesearchaeota archaeon]